MVIRGFKLGDLLNNPDMHLGVQQALRQELQEWWESHLPKKSSFSDTGIRYVPKINVQKVENPEEGFPYFLAITNTNRENRPKSKPMDLEGHCVICASDSPERKYMETEGYMIIPNVFPIVPYHSLIVTKRAIDQNDLHSDDLEKAMEFSFVFDQFLIYNQRETGGTVNHLHLQSFPYALEGHQIPLHGLLETYRSGNEFMIETYPAEHRCFVADPDSALAYARQFNTPLNMIVDKDVIMVVPRSEAINQSITHSLWAGLELCGGIVIGHIREGDEIIHRAEDLSAHLTFQQYIRALGNTTLPKYTSSAAD